MDWHQRYLQQADWTRQVRQYLYHKAGLENARRILDVGCGTGALLIEMNDLRGTQVHGLDISRENLIQAQSHSPGSDLLQGDAHSLPYADGAFDIAFCHFVLLWVNRPDRVVAEMKRVVRRGGAVLLLAEPDYGGRIDYPEELAVLGRLQREALSQQGSDPDTGRKLSGLLNSCGLEEVETGVLGGHWSRRDPGSGSESEWDVIRSDLEGRLTPQELTRLEKLDARAWERGVRVLFVPVFFGWGKKV